MGCCFSCNSHSCINCERFLGDYDVDYMCLLIGKGKYNNKYFCANCFYERIKNKMNKTDENYININNYNTINNNRFKNLE